MNRKYVLPIFALSLSLVAPVSTLAAPRPAPAAAGIGQERPWDEPPGEFQEMQRHGFRDGIEAARSDFNNHKRPDLERHDTYRHPDVSRADRHAFREGFRRGYEMAMSHMMNGAPPPPRY